MIKMAGYKVIPPDLEDCKSYDTYKKRLIVWEATTPAPDDKKGAIIAGTLPNDSARWPKDLQDKIFEQGQDLRPLLSRLVASLMAQRRSAGTGGKRTLSES